MAIVKITTENFEAEVLNGQGRILVDFYADWCGPCKMLSPILEKITLENPEIKICKINVDENTNLAQKYGVMSIPTVLVFEDGEVKETSVGLVSKSKIEEMLGL